MKQGKPKKEYRSTRDLAKAAAISLWLPIEQVDKTNPSRAIFLFSDCPQVRELEQQYDRGELRVEPRQYFDQIRAVKARLYA